MTSQARNELINGIEEIDNHMEEMFTLFLAALKKKPDSDKADFILGSLNNTLRLVKELEMDVEVYDSDLNLKVGDASHALECLIKLYKTILDNSIDIKRHHLN
jgi:hypothetical protein